MRVDDFDFDLPNERIALHPADPRHSAKMLVVNGNVEGIAENLIDGDQQALADFTVADLPNFLREGDALVFNDTKVIPAQLNGVRIRKTQGQILEAKIAVTLHLRLDGATWMGFMKNAKKVREGEHLIFKNDGNGETLEAKLIEKGESGETKIEFALSGQDLNDAFYRVGNIPLPPYIASKRDLTLKDLEDYQTIYAKHEGAVAAPTAGLHFTPELFAALDAKGISKHFVTLHVGAGTFLPVKVDDTDDHKMHSEWGEVSKEVAEALNEVRKNGGRVVSVGTTSLRLLESATIGQANEIRDGGVIKEWKGATDIFITPGYEFKAVDALMTNFHLPRSTLFMLVSAFAGYDEMHQAYEHAIDEKYRFYSYGDSSLLFPKKVKK